MISFKMVETKSISELLDMTELSQDERELLREVLEGYLEFYSEGELEFGAALVSGCLCTRVFDYGRYYFLAPYELTEDAVLRDAYLAVLEYARREELGYLFHELPREHLSVLLPLVRHADVDAEGTDGESFSVRIKTECELISEVPVIERDGLRLRTLAEGDAEAYRELCRDAELNASFGYSPTDEHPDASAPELVSLALGEFDRGLSIPLAIEYMGEFVGDAIIYGFDGMGGAELAMRISRANRGRGIGSRTLSCLLALCLNIGLIRADAYVKAENTPSVAMCKKYMAISDKVGDRVLFSCNLIDCE